MKTSFKGKKQFFKWFRWTREELGLRKVDRSKQARTLRTHRIRGAREEVISW